MPRCSHLVGLVAFALAAGGSVGCNPAAPAIALPDAPGDAAGDGGGPRDALIDALVDAPSDAPGPDLIALCGAIPGSLADWEDCYLQRWCEWHVSCAPLNSYRDVAECVTQADAVEGGRLGAERAARERAVSEGRAALEPEAFARCLADLAGDRCNTASSSVACAGRYRGEIGDGGPCSSSAECASPGAVCKIACAGGCCAGTCQPKFELAEACTEYDSCEPGLRCRQVCRAGDVGTACAEDRDCDSDAWCNGGTCAADLPPGAACTSPLQCGGESSCIGLSVSQSTPGKCQPISSPGDRCDYFCYGNLYCDASKTCRELPAAGESCPASPCRGVDTYCRSGRCVSRVGAGAACTSSFMCMPGLFCTSELGEPSPVCASPRGPGQPCTAAKQCDSYLCSGAPGQPGACVSAASTCVAGAS